MKKYIGIWLETNTVIYVWDDDKINIIHYDCEGLWEYTETIRY